MRIDRVTSHGYVVFLASDLAKQGALSVTVLDSNGAVVQSNVPVVDPAAGVRPGPRIVVTDIGFVIGWIGNDGLVHTSAVLLADVLANRVPLSPVQSGTPGNATLLTLASNGSHLMAFWYEAGTTQEFRARPLRTSGLPDNAAPVRLGPFRPIDSPEAAALESGYQLLFRESSPLGFTPLVSMRVGTDGTVQSAVQTAPINGGYSDVVAQNGGVVAAASEQHWSGSADDNAGWQAVAFPIFPDATLGPAVLLSLDLPLQHVRQLVPFGAGAVALWTEDAPSHRLYVGRISASGTPVDGAGLRILGSPYDQDGSAMATNGEQIVVAWTEGSPSPTKATLLEAIISPSPSLTATVSQLAFDALGGSRVNVSWNGQSFVITYSHLTTSSTYELAAFRTDHYGNVLGAPVSLMPTTSHDINPRLVPNGTDYLLLWERWYDPFFFITTPPPCWTPPKLPNELFAQRYDAALIPAGAPIALATTTNYNDYLLDVQGADASVAGGIWLVTWIDRWAAIRYARIDQNGIRLEPLDGQLLMPSPSIPFLSASERGWLIASQDPMGVQFARVGIDGTFSAPVEIPRPGIFSLEAIIATPSPLVAYTRPGSTAAYVDILPPRRRSVAH